MRLRETALEVMEQKRLILLNAEESLKFTEALLAPPKGLPTAFKQGWK